MTCHNRNKSDFSFFDFIDALFDPDYFTVYRRARAARAVVDLVVYAITAIPEALQD